MSSHGGAILSSMETEAITVRGLVTVGEAEAVHGVVQGKLGLSSGPYWGVLGGVAALVALSTFGGGWLAPRLGMLPDSGFIWGFAISVAFAFTVGPRLGRRMMQRNFRNALAARGVGPEIDVTYRLDAQGLEFAGGGVETRVAWPAVTELFRAGPYWVFLVNGTAIVAPRRFLAEPGAERAFLTSALAHMSEPARQRSQGAAAFARPGAEA